MDKLKYYFKIFWPGLVLLVSILSGYYLFDDYKTRTRAEIESNKASIAQIEASLEISQKIVNQFNNARNEFKPYLSMLFPAENPDDLIQTIRTRADSRGILMSNIQLDVPKFIEIRGKKEAMSIVPFEIMFTGEFVELGKFLKELETAPYLQSVIEIGISSEDESGQIEKLSIKGAFRFFQKDIIEELAESGT